MEIRSVNIKDISLVEQKSSQASGHNDPVDDDANVNDPSGQRAVESSHLIHRNAVFAVDENKNVVIRLVDEDGNVIRQIPPEDYLEIIKQLKTDIKSHYDIVA